MCPRPHLGTLSDIHCRPVPDLWVFGEGGAEPGCNTSDIRGSQVWGSRWARGREAHSQQPLDQAQLAMAADLNGTQKWGSVRVLCTRGSLEGPGEDKARLVLGRQPPQALGFTVNLVHLWPMQGCSPKGSQRRRACRGPQGLCGSCASTPARPQSPHRLSPPGESQRPRLLRGSYVSNTVCQHT